MTPPFNLQYPGADGFSLERHEDSNILKDPRNIPLVIVLVFLLCQLLYALSGIISIFRRSVLFARPSSTIGMHFQSLKIRLDEQFTIIRHSHGFNELKSFFTSLRQFLATRIRPYINRQVIKLYGGHTIVALMLVRALATYYVFVFESWPYVYERDCGMLPSWVFGGVYYCVENSLNIASFFAFVESIVTFGPRKWRRLATTFHYLIVASMFAIYVYRDVWPLARDESSPKDRNDQPMLWYKIGLLAILTIIIPLSMPTEHRPVNSEKHDYPPNPEQTASWFSALTYAYVDPLISLANRVPHLRHDQLPPLADYDYTEYLSASAFPFVDQFSKAKRRHLFFGLMSYFRKDILIMASTFVLLSVLTFAAPIGINKTLEYLESDGNTTKSTVKPWFWVSLMFFGPVMKSICEHWNLFVQTKVRVRTEAILTQLVFEHSLRIRVKAEIPSGSLEQKEATPVQKPGDGVEVEAPSELGSFATPSGEASAVTAGSDDVPSNKSSGDTENLVGKINNLVTSDMENISDGVDFLSFVLFIPTQIILSMIFLYQILGWSAVVGLVTTVVLSPVAGFLGSKVQGVQVTKTKLTDARIQTISEAVGVLRMIKMFGWERKMNERISKKRDEELEWLWKMKILQLATQLYSLFIPTFTMLATYVTYTVFMKGELTASKIFSSMAVFSILREQLFRLSAHAPYIIEGKVSLDRVNDFVNDTELIDRFCETREKENPGSSGAQLDSVLNTQREEDSSRFGFKDATFSWSDDAHAGSLTPSSRNFRLHVEGELSFKRNGINLIIGPTGSGKTSLLMALLGEMHFNPSKPDGWFNLPRSSGLAYAAQEAWIQNATIKENILFGSEYDEQRYQSVIRQCGLEHDLELFEAGDETEVGERGLTLSGGQKARVSLARAVYSPADIILLDDVFAALDVHTSAYIVDNCLLGDLVKGRTVLLVTHNVALVGPVADFIISFNAEGKITTSQGPEIDLVTLKYQKEALKGKEEEEVGQENDVSKKDEPGKGSPDGKLVMPEEIVQGRITWRSMKLLLSALGGKHPWLFLIFWVSGIALAEYVFTLQTWFLGRWGSQYETRAPSEVALPFYISFFSFLLVAHIMIFCGMSFYYYGRTIAASRSIHSQLLDSIFGSTIRWLDETPTGRIIARCTKDINTVDGLLPNSVEVVLLQSMGMTLKLGAIVLFTPSFLLPGALVAALGIYIGNRYLKAQLSIRREMSNARSPLLSHFSAALHGLVSIRAYNAQGLFTRESYKRIDHYSRAARTSWTANRWVGIRIDSLGAIFTSALAFYLVFGNGKSNASNTGFSLNMSVSFCYYIFWLIRIYNELEVESNSLERIQGFIDIEHEPVPTESGKPPAAWPSSGEVRAVNLSARYSASGSQVLSNISFNISSGERIGVVGRTGSGKSSLTLALLRCIITEGALYYDNVDINSINLDALRASITVIPQIPELLSGTLRENLDPFDQYDDASLNSALQDAGLFSLQDDDGSMKLSLDSKIAAGGGNLSVGQRQIIALARAMARGSKLLILDEATSAIDYKTETVIQNSLRKRLPQDVTVITVAHRLQTIMDADKIMVLNNGRVIEFDSPGNLLRKDKGLFKSFVDGSNDKDALQAVIKE